MRSIHDSIPTVRRTGSLVVMCLVAILCFSSRATASEARAAISVQAQVASRTSLNVSTQQLHFDVVTPTQPATASVDFSAAARTHAAVDVVLSVELLGAIGVNDEWGASASSLSFVGEGEGTRGGVLEGTRAFVAARWNGSGHRTGRFVFALSTREAGRYTVPVRFVLTAP